MKGRAVRKRRFRWALLTLILVALVSIFYQVGSSLQEQKQKEVGGSALEGMLPEAVQWIQHFRRIEIKDGKKVWEVEAEEAQYLQERELVLVNQPKAAFYLQEGAGEKVTVRADHGRLQFVGKDLQTVVLRDNVEIHVRNFVIRVEGARYNRASDRIVAKGPVSVVGDQVQLTGTNMIVFVKESRFELQQDVRVTLMPRDAGSVRPS